MSSDTGVRKKCKKQYIRGLVKKHVTGKVSRLIYEQGSLVWTNNVSPLFLSCFPKAWTGVAALTIVKISSFSLRKLMITGEDEDACDENGKPFTPLSLYSQHTNIIFTS